MWYEATEHIGGAVWRLKLGESNDLVSHEFKLLTAVVLAINRRPRDLGRIKLASRAMTMLGRRPK
jgi:hypothetical protein